MTEHTPGPWYLLQVKQLPVFLMGVEPVPIAEFNNQTSDADMLLCKAAPDLLKALIPFVTPGISIYDISVARAAIAKAKGES